MPDTFRKEYKPLSSNASELIVSVKTACEAVEGLMNKISNREMSIAKTNLEQAAMWAAKAIVLHAEIFSPLLEKKAD